MITALSVGDWVRSYSSGFWKIYRVLDYKCINPVTGKEVCETSIFSKRFVSNSFKRSFKEECCDPAFVSLLTPEEKIEIDNFIDGNPVIYQKFIDYEPNRIDCIYNARIGIPGHNNNQLVTEELENIGPIKDVEINKKLIELGFDTSAMPSWTVQFVSSGFECIGGYLSFRFSRVLER